MYFNKKNDVEKKEFNKKIFWKGDFRPISLCLLDLFSNYFFLMEIFYSLNLTNSIDNSMVDFLSVFHQIIHYVQHVLFFKWNIITQPF